jgi:hypothetical protein
VVFSAYSDFIHQYNWPPRYSWNIVESGEKHHKLNQTKPYKYGINTVKVNNQMKEVILLYII